MPMTKTWRFVLSPELHEAMHMAAAQKRITASQFARQAIQDEVDRITLAKSKSIAKVRQLQEVQP